MNVGWLRWTGYISMGRVRSGRQERGRMKGSSIESSSSSSTLQQRFPSLKVQERTKQDQTQTKKNIKNEALYVYRERRGGGELTKDVTLGKLGQAKPTVVWDVFEVKHELSGAWWGELSQNGFRNDDGRLGELHLGVS